MLTSAMKSHHLFFHKGRLSQRDKLFKVHFLNLEMKISNVQKKIPNFAPRLYKEEGAKFEIFFAHCSFLYQSFRKWTLVVYYLFHSHFRGCCLHKKK